MLYQSKDGILCEQTWQIYEQEKDACWLLVLQQEEFRDHLRELCLPGHIRHYQELLETGFRSELQVEDGYLYGNVVTLNAMNLNESRGQLLLIIAKKSLIMVEVVVQKKPLADRVEQILQKYKAELTPQKVFFELLDSFLSGGNAAFEKMDKEMVEMEHALMQNRMGQQCNKDIFYMKKRLSILKNYYEQMIDLSETLSLSGREWMGEEARNLHLFLKKAQRLRDSAVEHKEELVHVREAFDANMEYHQNQIMKIFTVVTTIVSPLTLITGWYGMNFSHMPELNSPYGYGAVAFFCALVVIVEIVLFKRKRLF